jgi:hypothetical protein
VAIVGSVGNRLDKHVKPDGFSFGDLCDFGTEMGCEYNNEKKVAIQRGRRPDRSAQRLRIRAVEGLHRYRLLLSLCD